MKKKSLFAAGAVLLSAAFGFTALAVSGVFNPFAVVAAALGDSTLTLSNQFPAANGTYNGGPNSLTRARFTYDLESGQKLELIPSDAAKVVLTPENGDAIELSLAEGTSCLTASGSDLYVNFPAGLEAGKYTLTVPAGVAHVGDAVNAAISTSFTVKVAYLKIGSTIPANNETLPSFPNVTECCFTFTFGGDDPMTLSYPEGASVTVKKDGEAFAEYPVTADSKNVYMNRLWTNRLYVSFGQALQPGLYEVTVPEGICNGPAPSSGDDSLAGEGSSVNPEITLTFTVTKAFEYTISPAVNTTVSRTQMEHVVLTYPEGANVEVLNSALRPRLTLKDNGGATTADTIYYNVSAAANKLELTADLSDGKVIPTDTRAIDRAYFHIDVQKGLFKVSEGETSVTNIAMDLGNWQILPMTMGDFSFEPALDTPDLTIDQLDEITIILPKGATWKENELKTTYVQALFTLYPLPLSNSFQFQYLFKSVSDDGTRITCTRKANTDPTSQLNNTALVQTGSSIIRIAAKKITLNGEQNGAMDIPAYNLKGREDLPIYNSTPKNGGTVKSLNSVTLNFLRNATVAEGKENATMRLTKEGESGNLKTVKVGETTTPAAKAGGAGAASAAYKNLFKQTVYDDEGNESEVDFTAPGVYHLIVPKGAFAQKDNGWTNPLTDIEFYIPGDFPHTYSPAPADFSGATVVPAEQLSELSEIILTYPGAGAIELTGNFAAALNNSSIGIQTYANAQKNSQTASPSNTKGITVASAEVIGKDQVKITLNRPWTFGVPADRALAVKIQQGLFNVIKFGDNGAKEYSPNPTMVVYYQPIAAKPGTLDYPEAGSTVITKDKLTPLYYTASESAYSQANIKAWLQNAEGVKVLDYTGAGRTDMPATMLQFTAKLPEDVAEGTTLDSQIESLPEGDYTFVISKGTMQMGGTGTSTACYNLEDWTYPVTLKNTPLPSAGSIAEAITLMMPAKANFTPQEAPMGMGMIVLTLSDKGIKLNPACENKYQLRYEGDVMAEFTNASPAGLIEIISYVEDTPGALDEEATEPTEPQGIPSLVFNLRELPEIGEYLTQAYGKYEIVIPDDALINAEGQTFTGTTLAYDYQKPVADFTYTLSPTEGETFSGRLSEITLTFPNASLVDYKTGGYTLTNKEGVSVNVPTPNYVGTNGIKFSFTNAKLFPNSFWVDGEYTFAVANNKITVDSYTDDDDPNWFEGLTAKYYVQNGLVGVTAIAADADGLYQIYSADGKAIRLNAAAADLDTLEPGLYIINGQKVLLRK